jgi:hypothetical protein
MGCGLSKPTAAGAAVAALPSPSDRHLDDRGKSNAADHASRSFDASVNASKALVVENGSGNVERQQQQQSYDYDDMDSDGTSIYSYQSIGDQLKENIIQFSDHVSDFTKSAHRRRSSSKLGLDEIKNGENHNLVRIEVPLGKPIEEVYMGVHDGQVLGSGVSGIVRRVTHRATQVEYAVKCLDLALIDSDAGLRQLKEEIYIMCQLVSGFITIIV